jgi:hypothetical protein
VKIFDNMAGVASTRDLVQREREAVLGGLSFGVFQFLPTWEDMSPGMFGQIEAESVCRLTVSGDARYEVEFHLDAELRVWLLQLGYETTRKILVGLLLPHSEQATLQWLKYLDYLRHLFVCLERKGYESCSSAFRRVWGTGVGYVEESFMALWKEKVEEIVESGLASLILKGWRNLTADERADRIRRRHDKVVSVKSAVGHHVFDIMAEVTVFDRYFPEE